MIRNKPFPAAPEDTWFEFPTGTSRIFGNKDDGDSSDELNPNNADRGDSEEQEYSFFDKI